MPLTPESLRLKKRRLKQVWFDINDCPERWHTFKRCGDSDFIKAFHHDGEECEVVRFYIPENTDLEQEDDFKCCTNLAVVTSRAKKDS